MKLESRQIKWHIFHLGSLILLVFCSTTRAQEFKYEYQPSPIDNPIRGLVPYAAMMPWIDPDASESVRKSYLKNYNEKVFPHSLEFHYFSMRELMPGKEEVDFSPIENWLYQTSSRGCQLTFRIFLEYPGRDVSVPQYLIDDGLKIVTWKNPDAQTTHAPDYNDKNLRTAIDFLIEKLGEKYDGDPRVACLTMGILGHWGEWHSYPRGDLFPDKDFQRHVMQQFSKSFTKTPILMRYPAGPEDGSYAANHDSKFGFHDDSFAWATRITGKEDENWFFLEKMKSAGAINAWKTRMIGGEIRPEVWGCVFDDTSCAPEGQGFVDCVSDSHVTWLMDSGMFDRDSPPSKERIKNATLSVGKMGYEFFVPMCTIESGKQKTSIVVGIENRGVAPFYLDWPLELAILDSQGEILVSKKADLRLPSVLPGKIMKLKTTLATSLESHHQIGLRISNPMTNGKPIRFANKTGQNGNGWLILR